MNVSGKSLQDIFNSGAKKLEELETAQKETLGKTTSEHLEEHFRQEPDSLNRLEESSKELEAEVRGFLTRAMDRINRAIKTEVDENDRYIHQLVEGLVLLAKKFGEEVEQLKQASQQDLSHLSVDCEELYRRHADYINSELQKRGASSSEDLHSTGNRTLVKISAEAEHNLTVLRDEEGQSYSKLYTSFDACAKSVNGDFEKTRSKEQAGFDAGCQRMKERSEAAVKSVKEFVEGLLTEIDQQAITSRSGLSENHKNQVDEGCAAVEQSAARVSADLVALLESSMIDLSMKSQELSRDMDSLSQDVKQTVENKDRDCRRKDEATSEAFTNDLAEKLAAAKSFQQEMEQERSMLVGEIWKELNEVQKKFQEKLSNLAASTLEQLQSICTEAQQAIVVAQESCASEFEASASERQKTIQSATEEFLHRVKSRREAALSGIARAAGATVNESAEVLAQVTQSSESSSGGGDKEASESKSSSGKRNRKGRREYGGQAATESESQDTAEAGESGSQANENEGDA